MVFVKKLDGEYFVYKRTNSHARGRIRKDQKITNVFRIKIMGNFCGKIKLDNGQITFPSELIGKRVMLKAEILPDDYIEPKVNLWKNEKYLGNK